MGGDAATVFRDGVDPHNDGTNNFYTANLGNGIAAIGYKSQPVLVQLWSDWRDEQHLWVGPEIQTNGSCCSALDLTVDYGWLWFIFAAVQTAEMDP